MLYNSTVAITRSVQTGFVTGATLGGTSTAYTYNTFGELGNERHTGAGATLYDVQYTRDKLGRITQRIETVGGAASTYGYVYDAAGRLVQVTKNGAVISAYAYDQNGNRLGKTDSIGTTAGTYDAQDRLLTYGTNSYAYTANGELLTKTNPQGTTSYTYDVLGNLTAVTLPDGTLIEYVIDGSNRRVGKKVNGVLAQGFLYANQLNPIAELDGSGNVVSTFIYGTKANVPDYMIKGGVTCRIISNHLGSPVLVVDSTTGTVAQQITYDEFGNILTDTNPGFIPFAFAGGLYEPRTGLVRFGFRDYDPDSGRWTRKDPIRFYGGEPNLYGYVLGDPLNYLDNDGTKIVYMPGVTPPTNQTLLEILQKLDDADPCHDIIVSSGLRSPQKQEGLRPGSGSGPNESQHVKGNAADVTMPGKSPKEVAEMAKGMGATGTIVYPSFTHVDTRSGTEYHHGY